MDVLRPSLLPGLIHSLRHNVSRKNYDVALFEIGRVFTQRQNGATKEERRVAIASPASARLNFWSGDERDAKFDAYDLKGLVEEFLEQFGVARRDVRANARKARRCFSNPPPIALGGKLPLGELGQFLPALAKKYDLRDAVFLAELNLDQLLARRNPAKSFKPLPQFPVHPPRRGDAGAGSRRRTKPCCKRSSKPSRRIWKRVELFDVFRGKNVPEGQKSLAYAFTYRSAEKTLTDAEVNAAHAKIVEAFKSQLKATVRE